MTKTLRLLLCGAALSLPWLAAVAQGAYPNKPVKFITASVGSPQDLVGRLIGQKLSVLWGQPVIVENRPGAGSVLSITTAARAPADGYSVLLSSSGFTVSPSIMSNPGYDAEKDFIPVALVASTPNIIIAGNQLPATSLRAVVDMAKSKPLNYGSPGLGTTPQLSAEYLFKSLANVPVMHVPYSGASPAVAAVAGGQVELASVALPAAVQLVKGGKVRALAVTSNKRTRVLPDVPTIAEAGFTGFEDSTWVGLWLQKGTPASVVDKIAADVEAVVAQPEVREQLANLGFEPSDVAPKQFAAYQKLELAKWAKVVKATGAKQD
ncbi:MAG: tripartite tricarboxylate transporter substrate binding protein [Polaromonas sp.]|nr:tripartite tricarboxylate transporter substrate binding protein [Polaromonas sp.]